MSDFTNPYASMSGPPTPAAKTSSGAITAIGVISILLASLGLLTAEFGIVALAAQPLIQDLQEQAMKSAPQDVRESQMRMQTEINAQMKQYMVPQIVNLVMKLVVEVLLLIAGILVLKRSGSPFVSVGFVAAIIGDLISFGVQTFVQMSMAPAIQKQMEAAMKQGGGNGPDVSGLMRIGTMIGLAFGLLFVLAKIGFYAWSLTYTRKHLGSEK